MFSPILARRQWLATYQRAEIAVFTARSHGVDGQRRANAFGAQLYAGRQTIALAATAASPASSRRRPG
jgi:hypothetical protein